MSQGRYTIGRLPDNATMRIDNPAVSGHHSLVINILNDSFLEDLNSTNAALRQRQAGQEARAAAWRRHHHRPSPAAVRRDEHVEPSIWCAGRHSGKTMIARPGAAGRRPEPGGGSGKPWPAPRPLHRRCAGGVRGSGTCAQRPRRSLAGPGSPGTRPELRAACQRQAAGALGRVRPAGAQSSQSAHDPRPPLAYEVSGGSRASRGRRLLHRPRRFQRRAGTTTRRSTARTIGPQARRLSSNDVIGLAGVKMGVLQPVARRARRRATRVRRIACAQV